MQSKFSRRVVIRAALMAGARVTVLDRLAYAAGGASRLWIPLIPPPSLSDSSLIPARSTPSRQLLESGHDGHLL